MVSSPAQWPKPHQKHPALLPASHLLPAVTQSQGFYFRNDSHLVSPLHFHAMAGHSPRVFSPMCLLPTPPHHHHHWLSSSEVTFLRSGVTFASEPLPTRGGDIRPLSCQETAFQGLTQFSVSPALSCSSQKPFPARPVWLSS